MNSWIMEEVLGFSRRNTPFSLGLWFLTTDPLVLPVWADEELQARQLMERAKLTVEKFLAAKEMGGMRKLLRDAKGVFVGLRVLKETFIKVARARLDPNDFMGLASFPLMFPYPARWIGQLGRQDGRDWDLWRRPSVRSSNMWDDTRRGLPP